MAYSTTTRSGFKPGFHPIKGLKKGWKNFKNWTRTKVSHLEKGIATSKRRQATAQARKVQRQQKALEQQERKLAQTLKNNSLKAQNARTKAEAKLAAIRAKGENSRAKVEANSQRGGLIGHFARRRKRVIAENEAKIKMAEMEPDLSAAERRTKMNTEAKVRTTQAKGAAVATAASAISGGLASKSISDNITKQKQAEAEIETSKALVASLNAVPNYGSEQASPSGLQSGTRD